MHNFSLLERFGGRAHQLPKALVINETWQIQTCCCYGWFETTNSKSLNCYMLQWAAHPYFCSRSIPLHRMAYSFKHTIRHSVEQSLFILHSAFVPNIFNNFLLFSPLCLFSFRLNVPLIISPNYSLFIILRVKCNYWVHSIHKRCASILFLQNTIMEFQEMSVLVPRICEVMQ